MEAGSGDHDCREEPVASLGKNRRRRSDHGHSDRDRASLPGPRATADWRESRRNREVRVGLYENKPKIFTNESGQPSGIFVGILDEIARREKWHVTYVPGEWSEGLAALEAGRIDLMPDVAFSPERSKLFDFHEEEVIGSWSQVYANSKRPVRNLSDLDGRRLALLKGSIQQSVLEEVIRGFGSTVQIVEASSTKRPLPSRQTAPSMRLSQTTYSETTTIRNTGW